MFCAAPRQLLLGFKAEIWVLTYSFVKVRHDSHTVKFTFKVCSSVVLSTTTKLCSCCHDLILGYFHQPPNEISYPLAAAPSLLLIYFLFYRFIGFPIWALPKNATISYVTFCASFLSLSVKFSKFILGVNWCRLLFYAWITFHCVEYITVCLPQRVH